MVSLPCLIWVVAALVGAAAVSGHPMPLKEQRVSSAAEIGLIAVAGRTGGLDWSNQDWTDDVEFVSLSSGNPHHHGKAPNKMGEYGSAMYNNTIYVVSGTTPDGGQNYLWSFNLLTNSWTQLADFPTDAVSSSTAVALNGYLYVISGLYQSLETMNRVFAYEISTNTWKEPLPLPASSEKLGCALTVNNSIYYILQFGDFMRSDDGAKTWVRLSSMEFGQFGATCAQVGDDGILLVGNLLFGPENRASVYNITTDRWSAAQSMFAGRTSAGIVTLPESKNAMVCGGNQAFCEEYDWKVDQWKLSNITLDTERENYGLFLAPITV